MSIAIIIATHGVAAEQPMVLLQSNFSKQLRC